MKQRLHVTYEVTAEFDSPAAFDYVRRALGEHLGPRCVGAGDGGVYSLGRFKLLKIVRKK